MAAADASTRSPASSCAAGVPRRRSSSARSSAAEADDRVGGHALRFERRAARGGDRADRPEHRARRFAERRAASCSPPCAAAAAPGPSASTVPSRASSVARRGSVVRAAEQLAGAQARERERARPARSRSPSPAPPDDRTAKSSGSVPNRRVRHATGTAHQRRRPVVRLAGRRAGACAVAVAAPSRRRAANSAAEMRAAAMARRCRSTSSRSRPGSRRATKRPASACARGAAVVGADDRADRERHARQRDHRARAAQALRGGSQSGSAVEHVSVTQLDWIIVAFAAVLALSASGRASSWACSRSAGSPSAPSSAPAWVRCCCRRDRLPVRAGVRPARRAARRRDPRDRPRGPRASAAPHPDHPRHGPARRRCSARCSARRSALGIVWILAAVAAQTPGPERSCAPTSSARRSCAS